MPTNNNLFLTVPPMSATISLFWYACVLAAMTAVSDIGAILSPRAAPDKMAPPSKAGLPPNSMPAGNSVMLMALMVPKPDPVLIANKLENKNTTTVNAAAPMFNS